MAIQSIVSTVLLCVFDLDLAAVGLTAGHFEQEHSNSLMKSLLLPIIIKRVLPS